MDTKEIIEEFFEEQFHNKTSYFLYKDKQLLKQGDYMNYAKEQIRKIKYMLLAIGFNILLFTGYGITSLIEYGTDPNWFDLTVGLSSWVALILFLFYSVKEYYTIKSSISLLMKLLKKDRTSS